MNATLPGSHSPSLSIVIPTHGGRQSVYDTVRALLGNDYGRLEVIVVTDGASEAARDVLSTITDPRLSVLEQPKRGSAATRNAGLHAATGEWVAFVDDDDVPRPNWIDTWRKWAKDDTGAVVASVARHAEGSVQVRPCKLDPADPTMSASTLLAGAFWVRRELLEAIGGYDLTLKASQNHDLGLRLCDLVAADDRSLAIRHVSTPVIDVMVQESAQRDTRYGTSRGEAARLFIERYSHRLDHDRPHHASLLRIMSRTQRLLGNHRHARRLALRAVWVQPGRLANYRSLAAAILPSLSNPKPERQEGHQ